MSTINSVADTAGYTGAATKQAYGSSFNALDFLTRQVVSEKAFAGLVRVLAVQGGGVGAPARVMVQPMVSQADGLGNQTPHGEISNIPCFRLQGGAGAVVLDPLVGDIGIAVVCHRDHSTVKATGKIGGPGSHRENDWADGCYFGGFLGKTPTCYAWITETSIQLVEPGGAAIIMQEGTINTTGVLYNNGKLVGDTHEHSGVISGGDDTGPPV